MDSSGEEDSEEMMLEELVTTYPLPQRAKVTVGYDDLYNSNNSFSTADVIEAKRILCPFVSLTYVDGRSGNDVNVTVSTSNPTRFRLALPLSQKPRMYSSVRQLVSAWPLVVVARSQHSDPHPVFAPGDRLRLIRLDRSRQDGGKTAVLELKNLASLELVRLPLTYTATFKEAQPPDRLYTIGELADIARVPRQLVLREEDRVSPEAWIPGIPQDFSGYVWIKKPDYLVEVQAVVGDDDDAESEEANSFLVSIDSDITVVACEPDYVSMSQRECYLCHLEGQLPGVFPRVVSVLSWKEETTILQNHCVRPGDRLVLFSMQTVQKLAVTVGNRRFFVPLNHPDLFRPLDDSDATLLPLDQLVSTSTELPLTLELVERNNYVNYDEELLPRESPLRVEAIVEELSVLAAKIDRAAGRLQPSFRLPLRTRIELHFYERWRKSKEPPSCSYWDVLAEEVSKSVYHTITGTNWSGMPNRETVCVCEPSAGAADALRWQQTLPEGGIDPAPRPPPLLARSRTLPGSSMPRRPPPPPPQLPPPLPAPRDASYQLRAAQLNINDDDDDVDYESTGSATSDYEEIDDKSFELPADGNVSGFNVEQLQQLMQQLRIPASTLSEWYRLKVDGRTFAEMSDEQLAKYNVDLPLVTYFRDRSRLNVLSRL